MLTLGIQDHISAERQFSQIHWVQLEDRLVLKGLISMMWILALLIWNLHIKLAQDICTIWNNYPQVWWYMHNWHVLTHQYSGYINMVINKFKKMSCIKHCIETIRKCSTLQGEFRYHGCESVNYIFSEYWYQLVNIMVLVGLEHVYNKSEAWVLKLFRVIVNAFCQIDPSVFISLKDYNQSSF